MRDYTNGYSVWRTLNMYADELKTAIEEKDDELASSSILNLLWVICNEHSHPRVFAAGDGEFLFDTEEKADAMADIIELAGADYGKTGYYDPAEDERDDCVDEFTGKWYASFD